MKQGLNFQDFFPQVDPGSLSTSPFIRLLLNPNSRTEEIKKQLSHGVVSPCLIRVTTVRAD